MARAFARARAERRVRVVPGTGDAPLSGPGSRGSEPPSRPGDRSAWSVFEPAGALEIVRPVRMIEALRPFRARAGDEPSLVRFAGRFLRAEEDREAAAGSARRAGSMISGPGVGRRRRAPGRGVAETPVFLANRGLIAEALASSEAAEEGKTAAARPALTFLRQAEVASPAPMSYIYTQPPRAAADETRTIHPAKAQEVTAIVRQEVAQLMAGEPVMARFSRGDYVQIADQVYAVLARRLTVEAERVGWR